MAFRRPLLLSCLIAVVLGVGMQGVFHKVRLFQSTQLDITPMVSAIAKLHPETNGPQMTASFREILRRRNDVTSKMMTSKRSVHPTLTFKQSRREKVFPKNVPINSTTINFPEAQESRLPQNATLVDDSFRNATRQAAGTLRLVSTVTHDDVTFGSNFGLDVIFCPHTLQYNINSMSPYHHLPRCTLSRDETGENDDSRMCDVRDDVVHVLHSSTHVLEYYSFILPALLIQESEKMNLKDCLAKIGILIIWLHLLHNRSVAEKLKSFLFGLSGSSASAHSENCKAAFVGGKHRKQPQSATCVKELAAKVFERNSTRQPSRSESYKNLIPRFCYEKDDSPISCSKGIEDEVGNTMKDRNLSQFWKSCFSKYIPPRHVYTVCPATIKSTMSSELNRVGSLASLPPSWSAFRLPLASAGFYYDVSNTKRNADTQHELVCFACGVRCSKWDTGESPAEIHRRMSPSCPHVKTLFPDCLSGNFSSMSSGLGSSISSSLCSSNISFNRSSNSLSSVSSTSGSTQTLSTPSSQLNGHTSRNDGGDLETDSAAIAPLPRPLSVTVTQPSDVAPGRQGPERQRRDDYLDDRPTMSMDIAVYPQFSTCQTRLATFQKWPAAHFFDPNSLVTLGFFYAGYADCIRCFYCGVGLKSWERGDDVTEEHIRWRPQCGFTLATRGRRYVDNVLAQLNTESYGDDVRDSAPARQEPSPALGHRQSPPPIGNSSPSLASSSVSSAGSDAASPLSATLQTVREMGFPSDIVDRAVAEIDATGIPDVDLNSLVERIVELQQRNNSDTSRNDGVRADLQTDGDGQLAGDDSHRIRRLREENARLKEKRTCRACKTAMVGMIFLPCGHVVCCSQCGAKTRHCTLCKELIRATANVFLS